MKTQEVQFAIKSKNGVIKEVGKSAILQPKIKFKGGSVKFYEDKPKKKIN